MFHEEKTFIFKKPAGGRSRFEERLKKAGLPVD